MTKENTQVESKDEVNEEPATPASKAQETNQVQMQNLDGEPSIGQFIQTALQSGAEMEKLERLFELQKEYKADRAREKFTRAMSQFQKNCPAIEKKKEVTSKSGNVIYKYAPLPDIVETIKSALSDAGLSFSWKIENSQEDGQLYITAICQITHEAGHTEETEFTLPVTASNKKLISRPQEFGKTLTYAKRYSLTSALGISAGEDTDAIKNNNSEAVSKKSRIVFLLKELEKYENNSEALKETVKDLTDKELKEENFDEIIARLQVMVGEKNSDEDVTEDSHENQ